MIPIRLLLVDDSETRRHRLARLLDSSGGSEVWTAASPAAGFLNLARIQPDLLLLNPYAGRGNAREWRRAIDRYRQQRPLGVLALVEGTSASDREILEELADLGTVRPTDPEEVLVLVDRWAGHDDLLARAA